MRKFLPFFISCFLFSFAIQAQSVVINRIFKGTFGEDGRGQHDAIELLVVEDHVDMRNWILKDYANGVMEGIKGDFGGKIRFKDVALWKNLRSGTTIVIRQPSLSGTGPSPDPDYVEDTDASDFKIDLSAKNTAYFRPIASPNPTEENPTSYIDRTFMLNDKSGKNEIVLLRWDDGFGEGMGSENAVHAFAYGNVTSSSHYNSITSPKLHTATAPLNGAYAYAKSENKDITDFATVTGISKDKAPPTYIPPAECDESLSQKLLTTTTLVKSITSELIRYNYPGVKEVYISYLNQADENMNLCIIDLDLTDPKLSIEVGTQNDEAKASGTQTVMNMIPFKNSNSFEKRVVAGVNGDYFEFATGIPTGPVIKDRDLIKGNIGTGYYYFAQLDNKTYKIGDKTEYDILKLKLQEAIGGKYLLVQNGTIVSGVSDGGTRSRTALGLVNDKRAVIVVAERNAQSSGYSLPQLAQAMKALGAVDAINLDGGGSTTFVTREANGQYQLKNTPEDGTARSVSNALFVMRKTD